MSRIPLLTSLSFLTLKVADSYKSSFKTYQDKHSATVKHAHPVCLYFNQAFVLARS